MREIEVDRVRITARRWLSAGATFRVKRGSGPYAKDGREVTHAPAGLYVCLKCWRSPAYPARIYCEAIEERSGRQHSLYLQGPHFPHREFDGVVVRPYRIAIVPPKKVRPTDRQRKPRAHAIAH